MIAAALAIAASRASYSDWTELKPKPIKSDWKHSDERLRKAIEKRERRAAKRLKNERSE